MGRYVYRRPVDYGRRLRLPILLVPVAAPPAGVTFPQLINRRFLAGTSYGAAQVQE